MPDVWSPLSLRASVESGGVTIVFGRARHSLEGHVANPNAAFVGSIPQNYDQYLGPLLFHPYADDLVARVPVNPAMRVLETACGTGIVTERRI
jgi:hypothetical protein